jgi:hypothetical protein
MAGAATMRPEQESSVPRERLTAFSPLPPERNGIADYAAMLLGALAAHYECEAACEDWLAEAPPGVPVVDPALAHRRAAAGGGRVLHQLGNNPGHGFVLDALRRAPGVTTLHDPGLLHLRQTTGAARDELLAELRDAPPAFARYARSVAAEGRWGRADHLLFDMAGEALARSRALVVHSRFARNRLRALHGERPPRTWRSSRTSCRPSPCRRARRRGRAWASGRTPSSSARRASPPPPSASTG